MKVHTYDVRLLRERARRTVRLRALDPTHAKAAAVLQHEGWAALSARRSQYAR